MRSTNSLNALVQVVVSCGTCGCNESIQGVGTESIQGVGTSSGVVRHVWMQHQEARILSKLTAFIRTTRSSHSVLQCVVGCCSVLPCVAVCCRVLPCVAVCCSVL